MVYPQITRNILLLAIFCLSTYVIADNSQTATMNGIQESRFVKLDGIDQWITIRGANRDNPVLLLIHGGPGDAQSLLRSNYAVYENDFTLVQWDQRGAAKTYAANPIIAATQRKMNKFSEHRGLVPCC